MGDIQGALDSSRKAKNWVIAAVATGVALIVVFFFTGVLAALADGSF